MNEIKCIFCGTESNHVVINENGYKGKKCQHCGLIYISPRPSCNEIIDLYGHDEAYISAQSHIAAGFTKRLYAKHNLRIVRSFIASGSLLEIGAGAGYFLDEARRIGFVPYGLEYNPIQSAYIKNDLNIPCEAGLLETSIFNGKRFDVVYHCDVISHFFDPIQDFKKINRLMKDDSFLIFETGNIGEVNEKYFKYIQRFQYPDHLFFFSTKSLFDLLDRTGFELVQMNRYSIMPQLRVIKALSVLKSYIKRFVCKFKKQKNIIKEKDSLDNIPSKSDSFNDISFIKKGANIIVEYFLYLLRYKVGRILPKEHRLQTVIIIAKKKNNIESEL